MILGITLITMEYVKIRNFKMPKLLEVW